MSDSMEKVSSRVSREEEEEWKEYKNLVIELT